MKKLIKLVPMMALLLGLGVYTVNAKMKALEAANAQTGQEWTLNNTDPTNPDNYVQAPPGTQNDCERDDETVCIVLAPADEEGKPNFSAVSGLESALSSGAAHPNIIRGPYNP